MNRTITIAPVRKSIVVEATPARAFEVFTAGIDRWWPKDHGIGTAPPRESIIEPFVGGRWYTKNNDDTESVVGHVSVWRPGERFVVSWEINSSWKPDARVAFASEVEVTFQAESDGRTRVDLEHRNFERMGDPDGQKMHDAVEGGWSGLLAMLAKEISNGVKS
jgi:uncharacterized protein YndB with AHSA1/START domain